MTRILASAVRTCFGDSKQTFDALLAGASGVGQLRFIDPDSVNVDHGYHIGAQVEETAFRATAWLVECVAAAIEQAQVSSASGPIPVVVGTGLRELRSVERWAQADPGCDPDVARLHFTSALREIGPAFEPVLTISNACSASGHALALAQDMVELGIAETAVAAGTDAMTASMLAMIGRVGTTRVEQVRPFDADRRGVLLGEGAAAAVVSASPGSSGMARLLGTGLSCDAYHETATSRFGIARAMRDAFARTGHRPSEVDVVVAHGTGTELNDAAETTVLGEVFAGCAPLITGLKGAVGHTSGASALMSVDAAIRIMDTGEVPPIVGLRNRLPEGEELGFARKRTRAHPDLVQVDAFGFGGLNAVTLLEAIR